MTVERSVAERHRAEIHPYTQITATRQLTVVEQIGIVDTPAEAWTTTLPLVAECAGLFFLFRVHVAATGGWQLISKRDDACNPNDGTTWVLVEWDRSEAGWADGYVIAYSDGLRWWVVANYMEEEVL